MSPDPVTAPPPYTAPPTRGHSPRSPSARAGATSTPRPTDPTDRGPIGPSAAVIHLLERLGRVYDVRRPTPTPVAARRA
ncbi:hypothetical protein [Streptomyces griseorubiginosus]|uniref:hypothetical protein n=1 Tax=Streptomyces griseorubiginosus TaxID=67304 RepID=UPI00114081E2|nr:hypothetical protein [Streptomyces griseorubiginosus]